ncbi:heavy-metal-associated domain-containing protein [Acetobacter sp.]|uniref:heavy-metal-associated domain-containing protein n=1 Tax=Acetobacter sp. TaxID=440 RepID=UPI0025C64583|nr:heavy-metal-associated domain-containing protein [Acetobacter sp.]MCH4090689.1 heavy-metal-associated domain-containing protein [Acetobacter sp.]MCI1300132.1 heavy-metal-associated domain-containing protein [Acetobacter sp.]MCI1316550.1 heavy-metal-associated domain-containing protein [Acetobacter sp.]
MESTTLMVEGMTCEGCVSSVKRALEAIPGVKSAEPSLEKGTVKIEYDPKETGPRNFTPSIEAAGFEVVG